MVRRNLLALALTSSAAIAVAALPAAPAHAEFGATQCSGYDDPFRPDPGPDNCVSLGNNYTHTYRFAGVRSDLMASFRTLLAGYDQHTDLVVYERDPADVVIQDNNYGNNGAYGHVNCDVYAAGVSQGGSGASRWCYGQDLRVNLYYVYDIDTDQERRSLACHEFGHTVGLRHTWNSETCMSIQPNDYAHLHPDEVGSINNKYLPY